MTPEEKTKFEKMENTVEKIQTDVTEIKAALLGNSMSGDKGLVGRLEGQNISIEILESQMKTLIEEKIKNAIYIRLINWLLAVIGMGVIGGVITLFFNLLNK
ncbi:hypothetical protein ACNQF7_10150 [Flavobacterium sp. RSP29]|uniref:hypothetical protein n=1 Tax=Flavobacterium sp. RSP29 TaxID=3401731 RepID=UPI003AADF766